MLVVNSGLHGGKLGIITDLSHGYHTTNNYYVRLKFVDGNGYIWYRRQKLRLINKAL